VEKAAGTADGSARAALDELSARVEELRQKVEEAAAR
jgi:hypothetical protein